MDAITPEVEQYIYKISYWLTNIAVAFGALIGGLMYGDINLCCFSSLLSFTLWFYSTYRMVA